MHEVRAEDHAVALDVAVAVGAGPGREVDDARVGGAGRGPQGLVPAVRGRTATTTIPYRISPYDPSAGRAATDCRNQALRAASRATDTRVVDLAAWACPDGECDVERDGVVLRPDLVHFAGPGAEVAGGWVLDQLTSRG